MDKLYKKYASTGNLLYQVLQKLSLFWIVAFTVILHSFLAFSHPSEYDYPVHVHWMALTSNVPISECYSKQTWYHMDYPPMACYLFRIMGKVTYFISPDNFKFSTEHAPIKVDFMQKLLVRGSVILCELIFLFPPIIVFVKWFYKNKLSVMSQNILIFIGINLGCYVVVDHIHGQYNCVQIGLFLSSAFALMKNHTLIATCIFCMSAAFKITTVNFAPAFLIFVISKLVIRANASYNSKLDKLKYIFGWILIHAITGIITILIIILPWLNSYEKLVDMSSKIFPFGRKLIGGQRIPSFWYILNFIIPIEELLSIRATAIISFVFSWGTIIPFCIYIWMKPSKKVFIYGLVGISLTTYLFGFHMHEKVIMLPLFSLTLLFPYIINMYPIYNIVGMISVFVLMRYYEDMYIGYYTMLILMDLVFIGIKQNKSDFEIKQDKIKYSIINKARNFNTDRFMEKLCNFVLSDYIEKFSSMMHSILQATIILLQIFEGLLFIVNKQDCALNCIIFVAFCFNVIMWLQIRAIQYQEIVKIKYQITQE